MGTMLSRCCRCLNHAPTLAVPGASQLTTNVVRAFSATSTCDCDIASVHTIATSSTGIAEPDKHTATPRSPILNHYGNLKTQRQHRHHGYAHTRLPPPQGTQTLTQHATGVPFEALIPYGIMLVPRTPNSKSNAPLTSLQARGKRLHTPSSAMEEGHRN